MDNTPLICRRFIFLLEGRAQVTGVRVEITDEAGALRETGPAVLAVSQRWEYTLQESHSGPLTVTVSARDLPGHVTQADASKKLP